MVTSIVHPLRKTPTKRLTQDYLGDIGMNTSVVRRADDHRTVIQGRHAVVLGGSMAGLLAARVLTDHFEKVTIVERDSYPETAKHGGVLHRPTMFTLYCCEVVKSLNSCFPACRTK